MYPFQESLKYGHQRKRAKAEGFRMRALCGDIKRVRRAVRKNKAARNGFGPGFDKWVNRKFQSTNVFRNSYDAERFEQQFYARDFY